MFRSERSEPGGIGWSTDYPFGEINLLTRLSEMTKVRVSRDGARNVNYWVVRLTDDQLFECPILRQLASEVERLREERLLKTLEDTGGDAILSLVASLSESQARDMMRALSTDGD